MRREPTRPVPQYDGWTLADLASHTASIHGRTVLICEQLPSERIPAPTQPEGRDPVDWYDENLELMLLALERADPDTPCWALGSSDTLGFWESRMVVETGVHRFDADHALGVAEPLSAHVARTGLDEFGDLWLPMLEDVPTLEVRASDLDENWVYGQGGANMRLEGTASDIYLRLMQRPSPVLLPAEWAGPVDSLGTPKR